jgi:hypothetical protein
LKRPTWRGLLLGGLALVTLHGAAWLGAVTWLDAELGMQVARLRARGWQVDHGAISHAGWPFAARLVVPSPRLVQGAGNQSWQSAVAELAFDLRHPAVVAVTLTGPHVAALPGTVPMLIDGPPIEATVALAEPQAVDIRANRLRFNGGAAIVTVRALTLHAEPDPASPVPGDAVLLRAQAEEVDLADLVPASNLGSRLDHITLDAGLSGLLIPAPEPRAWRDAGGALAIHRLAFRWNVFDIELGATLGLDARLQPAGNGMVAAGGLPEAIDAMVGAGVIPAGTARTAKALLRLVPRTADGKLTVPVALKDRTISAARLPLAVVPEIRWQ